MYFEPIQPMSAQQGIMLVLGLLDVVVVTSAMEVSKLIARRVYFRAGWLIKIKTYRYLK